MLERANRLHECLFPGLGFGLWRLLCRAGCGRVFRCFGGLAVSWRFLVLVVSGYLAVSGY